MREFWTDWLPTETPFLPQNVEPRCEVGLSTLGPYASPQQRLLLQVGVKRARAAIKELAADKSKARLIKQRQKEAKKLQKGFERAKRKGALRPRPFRLSLVY